MGDFENENKKLSVLIKNAFINLVKDVHTCLPGEIVQFDATKQSAKVRLNIKKIFNTQQADGTVVKREEEIAALIYVPVVFPRGGGWCITFPVKPGDECIVHFAERAIDLWRTRGGVQPPGYWRMHSYSDAIAQCGLSSEPKVISAFSTTDMVIRNEANTVKVSLKSDNTIDLVSPVKVTVTAPEQVFNASSKIDFNTPQANFSGNVDIADTSTAGTDHISAGISGARHKHRILSGSSAPGPTDEPE
jgi:hypothetical protein